jgi:hypothetical protein
MMIEANDVLLDRMVVVAVAAVVAVVGGHDRNIY